MANGKKPKRNSKRRTTKGRWGDLHFKGDWNGLCAFLYEYGIDLLNCFGVKRAWKRVLKDIEAHEAFDYDRLEAFFDFDEVEVEAPEIVPAVIKEANKNKEKEGEEQTDDTSDTE